MMIRLFFCVLVLLSSCSSQKENKQEDLQENTVMTSEKEMPNEPVGQSNDVVVNTEQDFNEAIKRILGYVKGTDNDINHFQFAKRSFDDEGEKGLSFTNWYDFENNVVKTVAKLPNQNWTIYYANQSGHWFYAKCKIDSKEINYFYVGALDGSKNITQLITNKSKQILTTEEHAKSVELQKNIKNLIQNF